MNNRVDDEVFESLLKAAVIQNSLNEIDSYPPQQELEKITISTDCDRRIRRMIKSYWLKKRISKGLKVTQRIASVVAIIFGITFITLLQFKEVRAACYNIFIQITEKYIRFEYTSTQEKKTIKVTYIPAGYSEVERVETETDCILIFQNNKDERLSIFYFTESDVNLDNEHYSIAEVTVNGQEGKYFSSTDSRFANMLVWYTDEGYFLIEANFDKGELMKIANNIK